MVSLPKTIGFEIKSLANLIKRCIDESAQNSGLDGLTGMQGWIIGYLYHHAEAPETFQRDLEKAFHIRRSTATGILQLMEQKGLITREPVAYDARLKKLKLTPKAITTHEKLMHEIKAVEKRLRSSLSEEEIAAFFLIVDKIKRNIGQLSTGQED
jgi:DNA-binding MarR family transcriptional regulator